ncbi:MAG: G5 domain-containing protein, partial [Oscillospiraceae bacterium]|nr:G5 domain-containing protein [Oscillospiraceae bacterium]
MRLPTRAFANLVWRARCSGFEGKFKKLGIACGMLVFTGVLAVLFFNIFVSYAIAVDGQVVGKAPSLSKAEKIVSDAERYASGELGYDFSFMGVTYAASIGLADDPEEVTGAMLSRVDALDRMCLVTVDGHTVGALESEAQVNAMLAAITARYVTDRTESIYFKQDVQVRYGYVGEYTIRDLETVRSMLDPENESSPYALTVVTEERETEPFEVEFGSDEVFDMDMFEGEYELIREGVYGQSEREYRVIYINGVRSEAKETGTRVITEPINEVLAYGAKVGDTESTGNYQWPCEGVLTSGFGYRTVSVGSSYHTGIDIASSAGTPI